LADAQAQTEFSEVATMIEERNLPYPLVAVNGELRLAGTAQYYQVLPLVEELLQVKNSEVAA
jgi:disulfide oxidoreductase YuzD